MLLHANRNDFTNLTFTIWIFLFERERRMKIATRRAAQSLLLWCIMWNYACANSHKNSSFAPCQEWLWEKIKIKDEKYMGFAYKFLLLLNSTLASSTTNYVPFFENKRSSEKWQGSWKKGCRLVTKANYDHFIFI